MVYKQSDVHACRQKHSHWQYTGHNYSITIVRSRSPGSHYFVNNFRGTLNIFISS